VVETCENDGECESERGVLSADDEGEGVLRLIGINVQRTRNHNYSPVLKKIV
jgi:hypothetical protein